MNKTNIKKLPVADNNPKKLTILGATGTIGRNTAQLIAEAPENYDIQAITANHNVTELIQLAKQLEPKRAVIRDESLYQELKDDLSGTGIEVAAGNDAIIETAKMETDLVISGIVGVAALEPTMAAIESGSNVALANKESLVCAGKLITQAAKKHNSTILPVDSEHNAVFQSIDFDNVDKIDKITLTASGGPFYKTPIEKLEDATPEQAVKHPNWKMGAKISVDSATMMNKGLEVIEAYYLFPVEKNQIDVIIHPESIIHCLVHYSDGGIVAGLSVPDMKVPIAHAMAWPSRLKTKTPKLDLAEIGKLHFYEADRKKFTALELAREALEAEGSATTILNAANEVAVDNFLNGKIKFLDIVKLVENALKRVPNSSLESIGDVLEIDRQTRDVCNQLISKGI